MMSPDTITARSQHSLLLTKNRLGEFASRHSFALDITQKNAWQSEAATNGLPYLGGGDRKDNPINKARTFCALQPPLPAKWNKSNKHLNQPEVRSLGSTFVFLP